MNERRAPAAVAAAAERTTAPYDAEEALGWDEIAAIAILLMAAVGIHDRLPDLSILALVPRALWLLMYMAAAARLVQRFRAAWLVWEIQRQPALCVLLALAVVSSAWSLAPAITLQRAISLLGTTVLGMFIGHACPPRRLMRVLYWTFVVLMVTSVAAALVFPAPVGDGVPVGWRGIMVHKNSFGAAAVLATSCFVALALGRLIHPLRGGALSALGTIAVVEAHSRTSLVVFGVCLVAAAILAFCRATRHPHDSLVRRASFGLVLGISLAPFLVGPLASMFGNDDPLNGRTRIWDGAMMIFAERPLTGYGYAVVWGRSEATLLPHIAITAHRSAASAHNSIINIGTELGIPAAIVAGACLFGALSNAGRLFERVPSAFSLFALVFLIGFVLMGLTEAQLLQIHSVFWILFVGVTVAVTRALERRGNAAPAAGNRLVCG